jgi:hypothetical protein
VLDGASHMNIYEGVQLQLYAFLSSSFDSRDQTVDNLIYDCTKLQRESEKLISNISKQDNWPVIKSELVNKHIKHFIQFTNSIKFEKL